MSVGPTGKTAVARNNPNVKPIEAMNATTQSSRYPTCEGE